MTHLEALQPAAVAARKAARAERAAHLETLAATPLTKEWIIEATRAHLQRDIDRGYSTHDTVSAHDLWSANQRGIPGGVWGKAECVARLNEVMVTMIGDGPTDLYNANGVYLYWGCHGEGHGCDETRYVFRGWPVTEDDVDTDYECDRCGEQGDEEDTTPPKLSELQVELTLRPDAPCYTVDPERYRAEGRAAALSAKGRQPLYPRTSRATEQWYEGVREVRDAHQAIAARKAALAHPAVVELIAAAKAAELVLGVSVSSRRPATAARLWQVTGYPEGATDAEAQTAYDAHAAMLGDGGLEGGLHGPAERDGFTSFYEAAAKLLQGQATASHDRVTEARKLLGDALDAAATEPATPTNPEDATP